MKEKVFGLPILFMGTPDFAVIQLAALVENGCNIIGVVTQPDKPKGRGYNLVPPPVKTYASENGIDVYQPASLKGRRFMTLINKIKPALIVVAAYGKILPQSVIDFPGHGCINIHASLLPRYRGAAPIQRAIIDGETVSGITIMQMDAGLDTGDILYAVETPIEPDDNFETLHDRLAQIGSGAIIKALNLLAAGRLTGIGQDDTLATYAKKIENGDCVLDFSESALRLHNRIRGLSPVPLAFTYLRGKKLKIIESAVCEGAYDAAAGTVLSTHDKLIHVACGEGVLAIKRVLPEGRRPMSAADYINGRNIAAGDLLGNSP
ncbi:MAG: methionyl-tRNA formyltransferase [Eubacteriales bacterium]|jgi:methionyl-tRNA formyltransferase|nr:methionyl-tRNA formyltransferase [Eubacteriales bacterium]